MPINPLRGEAKLVLAGNEYVLAITMESLAQLSSMVGDPPFEELFNKLMRGAIATQRAALGVFVQSGAGPDGKPLKKREAAAAAVRDFSLAEMATFTAAMVPLLGALTRKSADDDSDNAGNPLAAQA